MGIDKEEQGDSTVTQKSGAVTTTSAQVLPISSGNSAGNKLKDLINKHEIFKNATRDIKQNFIDQRQAFVPTDSNHIKVSDIDPKKYYRIVIASGTDKCVQVKVDKKGKYNLKVIRGEDKLNNIWQLQLQQADGKFKLINAQYPDQTLNKFGKKNFSLGKPAEGIDTFVIKDTTDNAVEIYSDDETMFLSDLTCSFKEIKLLDPKKRNSHFYLQLVEFPEFDKLSKQEDYLNKFDTDAPSQLPVRFEESLQATDINLLFSKDRNEKKFLDSSIKSLNLSQQRSIENDKGAGQNKEQVEEIKYDLILYMIQKYFEPRELRNRIRSLPRMNSGQINRKNLRQSFKFTRCLNSKKNYAIQKLYDDANGSFKLNILQVNDHRKNAFSDLIHIYGPVTLVQDERFKSKSRNSNQFTYPHLHPEFISVKICNDGIEFVASRNGKKEITKDDLTKGDLEASQQDKTLVHVKFIFDTMKVKILNVVQTTMSELAVNKQVDDNTVLLPFRYPRFFEDPDEEYEHSFMSQIGKFCQSDELEGKILLTDRDSRILKFQDNTVTTQKQMTLPLCKNYTTTHEIFVNAKFLAQKLETLGLLEAYRELVKKKCENYIFVFYDPGASHKNTNKDEKDSRLIQILADDHSQAVPEVIMEANYDTNNTIEPDAVYERMQDLKYKLALDKINQQNTVVLVNDHEQLRERHIHRDYHEFILWLSNKIQANKKDDHVFITTAFLDDMSTGFMTILIANYAVDVEPKKGELYQDYIVLRFNKNQTNYNYAVTRSDYDINQYFKVLQRSEIEVELSQHCFDLCRDANSLDWKLFGAQQKKKTKIGKLFRCSDDELDSFRKCLGDGLTLYIQDKNNIFTITKDSKQQVQMHDDAGNEFNRMQTLEVLYAEDDRNTIPAIFYNLKDPHRKIVEGYKFWLIDLNGKPVSGTIIDFYIDTIYGGDEQRICMSSEVTQGRRLEQGKYQGKDYMMQHFQVQIQDGTHLSHVFEIEVKYFSDGTCHAMLVGKKLIITKQFKYIMPMFLRNKANDKIKIMGTSLSESQKFPNPDLTAKLDNQFDFVGSFVCTRVKQFEDTLVVESYLKEEWVAVGHLEQFELIKTYNRQLRLELLNNAIFLAMNSQVLNISDFMNSELVRQETDEDFQKMLINKHRYFMTSSILDGRSIAEFCFNDEMIDEAIQKWNGDVTYAEVFDEIKQFQEDMYFLLSPVQKIIYDWDLNPLINHEGVEKTIAERYLLNKSLVYANFDLVTNLQTMLQRMKEERQIEKKFLFESMVESLQDTDMLASYKREQIMSSLNYALKDFQNNDQKQKSTFKSLIQFLDDYQDDVVLRRNFIHTKEITPKDVDKLSGKACLRISGETKKEKLYKHISNQIETIETADESFEKIKNITESEKVDNCCFSANYNIKSYFIDWNDLNQAIAIDQFFKCENVEQFVDINERMNALINKQTLVDFTQELYEMCKRADTEINQYLVLQDIINHNYINYSWPWFAMKQMLFLCFYIFPMTCVLLGAAYTEVYVKLCMGSCIATQIFMLVFEVMAAIANCKRNRRFGLSGEWQNIIDFVSIVYSIAFCSIRIVFMNDVKSVYNYTGDDAAGDLDNFVNGSVNKTISDAIPIMGVILTFLAVFQWMFYLQTYDELNKNIRLLYLGIYDSLGFMIFLGIWTLAFTAMFMQIGTFFDDGGNFQDPNGYSGPNDAGNYNAFFNDYPNIDHGLTMIIAQIRTSFGDVSPPSYDYWGSRLSQSIGAWKAIDANPQGSFTKSQRIAAGDLNTARFYIFLNWFLYFLQFYLTGICLLNFLIAIVSESYNIILDTAALKSMQGRIELNEQYILETNLIFSNVDTIYSIVFAARTVDEDGGGDDDNGTSKRIQRQLYRLEADVKKKMVDLNQEMTGKIDTRFNEVKELLKAIKYQTTPDAAKQELVDKK